MTQELTIQPNMGLEGTPIFDEAAVRKYWSCSLPPQLEPEETVRVVSQIYRINPETGQREKTTYGIVTIKDPIRSVEDLIYFYNDLQRKNPGYSCGISVSTAVFNYVQGEAPVKEQFKYCNTIAIDIDAHIKKGEKERKPLFLFNDKHIKFSIMTTWNELSKGFKKLGLEYVEPKMTLLSGGGLQFLLEFSKPIDKNGADRIYNLMKRIIGGHGYYVTMAEELTGVYDNWYHEYDSSFTDISHVQRCCGTINQKYGNMAREIDVFGLSQDEYTRLYHDLKVDMSMTTLAPDRKEQYNTIIEAGFKEFTAFRTKAASSFDIDTNLVTAKMEDARAGSFIKPTELKSVEHDLLANLKRNNIKVLDLLHGMVRLGPCTGNLTKLFCPFHEESNPSMAFYENELFDVFKDFHDGETYSFIAMWEKLYECTKSEAISQIAEKAGITLGKGERKDFQNLEMAEIIELLLERIDIENFVYYRLANKNRTCVVRHIDKGDVHHFDGPKMLANHILENQLNVTDAEETLVHEFAKRFQEKVLVDAFEEFDPGNDTIFKKQFIKFVNLWVPSDRYKNVHKRAIEIQEQIDNPYNLEEAITLIKKKTPWTYKYILQLVQNGDLVWFINWLSAQSKFVTVPTVPVVFGVQGAGKNLFVNTILDHYINNEYIKVVSGDRIMQQFNSILESTSLLVLDEGDFSNGKEIDQLKLLTGNDKILIEKKGVDATNKTKHFNTLFFSNGEVPIRHPAMDRRITYFNNEISLLASCEVWGLSIDDMMVNVRAELNEFWAIIVSTELDHKMAMQNSKNGQFWKQILMQHPFGALVVKMMDGEWNDIALQLNENVQDPVDVKTNLGLLEEIKNQFESGGKISVTLVNRYMHSLNFKMKQSIQKFIQTNYLHEFGINVSIENDDVKIIVDRKKVRDHLKVVNVLKKAYPKTAQGHFSSLEAELAMEETEATVEAIQVRETMTPPPAPQF